MFARTRAPAAALRQVRQVRFNSSAPPPRPPPTSQATRDRIQKRNNFIALGLVGAGIACYYAFFQDVDVETRKLQAAVNANAKAAADEVAKAAKSAAAEKVVAAEKAANNASTTSLE